MSLKDDMYDVFITIVCSANIDSMSELEIVGYYETLNNTYPCNRCDRIKRYEPFLSLTEKRQVCKSLDCKYYKVLLADSTSSLLKFLRMFFETNNQERMEDLKVKSEKERTESFLIILRMGNG